MKKLILSVTALAACSVGAYAQSVQFADAASTADVTIGGHVDTAQDVILELLAGTSASTLSPVATLGVGALTASGDVSTYGFIYDQNGSGFYTVPGATASTVYEIEGWITLTGSAATAATSGGLAAANQYASYAAAAASGDANTYFGTTATWTGQGTGSGINTPPALAIPGTLALTSVSAVPEPSTLAMAGVGLASMLMFRRKNS